MLFDYDERDVNSILTYARQMEDLTYNDILSLCKDYLENADSASTNRPKEFINSLKQDKFIKKTNAKGQLGNFIEKFYFGYEPNGNQEADLSKAGIEIKQTPIDITKNGEMRAGERLSITMISYNEPVEEDFYKSHVWEKIQRILLIHYIRDKNKPRLDYQIKFVNLFTPPKEDLDIIIQDYKTINDKIKAGKAHELSESDTLYLGACTKGATAKKSLRKQYYNPDVPAKSRNFCFKNSYMNYVLQNYVLKKDPGESIIGDTSILNSISFEQYVLDRINSFAGKTDRDLCQLFDRPYNNNKAQWVDLSYRMLGIKGNHAQEFQKANIVVKAIRIEQNGKIKESMSFPPFKFKELVKEEWEESTLYEYFETTKFLFVVFKSNGEEYVLLGAQMWNMPANDLNEIVREGWEKIRDKISEGIRFEIKPYGDSTRVENDLPKKADNPIIHVRPHAQKAAFRLNNGYSVGNIRKDANQLPDGQWMTTQSFWINNTYILKQLHIL